MRSVAVAVGQGGDEDLHPRGHGGDDATCLWTRPSYHRDRPRPSRAAPARQFVRSFCPSHTNPRLCMGKGRRSRPFALSIPRVLLAEGRRGHGNATAVRSQSEPAADEDRRAANNAFCVCEGARPRGALPLCRRTRSPPGRSPPTRLVLPARRAPCRCRARRADRASGGGEPRIGAASQGAPAQAQGAGVRGGWARDGRPSTEVRASWRDGRQAPRALPQDPAGPLGRWKGAPGRPSGPTVVMGCWTGHWGIERPISVQRRFFLTYCQRTSWH